MSTPDLLGAMEADILQDAAVLRVKKKIVAVLKELPDNHARARVLRAVLAYHGAAVPADPQSAP